MKITPIAEEQVAEEERGYRVPFAMEVAGAWALPVPVGSFGKA